MSAPGNRALVTGGSAGLGLALVRLLAAKGYDVLSLDRDEPGEEDANEAAVRHLGCDLSDRAQLDQALGELVAAGPFDLVVLNAGVSATGSFETIDLSSHLDVLRVNAEAPMIIAARMLEEGGVGPGGAIGFISSLSHFTGYPGAASYAASKDALAVFAASIRKAAGLRNVTVTVAFPGPLRTAHAERHAPRGADARKRMDPSEAAELILVDLVAGRKSSIPGRANRAAALAGRLAPKPLTALMRRLIYERL
ncbi:MAG: SDR family NAD(P)-dependent oxidoreductase [Hoeflea sp.]|uniref:SDR family NAD(P)-dependent oxidoreductase n=1 Tax=Hoeflea sp. TaxID=1940281 RepID=UPI0032F06870